MFVIRPARSYNGHENIWVFLALEMHLEQELEELARITEQELVARMMHHGFIHDSMLCPWCESQMCLKRAADKIDKMEWRCINYKCTHYQTSYSIRNGSWLAEFRLPAKTMYKVLLYWANDVSQKDILRLVDIGRTTLSKLRKLIVSKISKYFNTNPLTLGGPGCIVQIDETMINHKIKTHRGRVPRQQVWILCIVDTSFTPSRGFCCLIENRTASYLLPIISRVVRAGSTIHTDNFRSYLGLANINEYNHMSVCHKYHFVDPVTGVHTQNVESFNNKIKRKIKSMNGLDDTGRKLFLQEFMFIDLFKESAYEEVLRILKINF